MEYPSDHYAQRAAELAREAASAPAALGGQPGAAAAAFRRRQAGGGDGDPTATGLAALTYALLALASTIQEQGKQR